MARNHEENELLFPIFLFLSMIFPFSSHWFIATYIELFSGQKEVGKPLLSTYMNIPG
jgi:hypothetical protein